MKNSLNNSGRVITIFVAIAGVLLVSLTAISVFFFKKEYEHRKWIELKLKYDADTIAKLESELAVIRKNALILEEKNKESDERINGLLDELELHEGLREEMKVENMSLKEELAGKKNELAKLQEKINQGRGNLEAKVAELETSLRREVAAKTDLAQRFEKVEQEKNALLKEIGKIERGLGSGGSSQFVKFMLEEAREQVELDKIVVVPSGLPEGRILSVDKETEFVIINLGEKDGLKIDSIMSVFRGQEYLGDIKVTRVQPEMAAADLIPPFSSRIVRKNDQVTVK